VKTIYILVWYYEPTKEWGYPMAIPYEARADAESAQSRVRTDVNSPSIIVEVNVPIEKGAVEQFGLEMEVSA